PPIPALSPYTTLFRSEDTTRHAAPSPCGALIASVLRASCQGRLSRQACHGAGRRQGFRTHPRWEWKAAQGGGARTASVLGGIRSDRKSTRLNSSHQII